MNRQRPPGIGIKDYKEMIDKGYYYADKTLLIKELLDHPEKVNLFLQPQGFGKTLTLSMLRACFEWEVLPGGRNIDNRRYFAGKKIMQAGREYEAFLGKYPVISLSFQLEKQTDFASVCAWLKEEIRREYLRHSYLLEGKLLPESEKRRYQSVLDDTMDDTAFAGSVRFLSQCLEYYHNQRSIILIDAYDAPFACARTGGFETQLDDLLCSLMESALKTNDSLEFAVVTGCAEIEGARLFSGWSNLRMISVLDDRYGGYFGFTREEGAALLRSCGLEAEEETVWEWYGGYGADKAERYQPWSLTRYVEERIAGSREAPRTYWMEQSAGDAIRKLVEQADLQTRSELEQLIAGAPVEKSMQEGVGIRENPDCRDHLWRKLALHGYLKVIEKQRQSGRIQMKISIPNAEIRSIYCNAVSSRFNQRISKQDFSSFFSAMERGDCEMMEAILTGQLLDTIVLYGDGEGYYAAFLEQILKTSEKYYISFMGSPFAYSDEKKEAGGRLFVARTPFLRNGRAMIAGIEVAQSLDEMESRCQTALIQRDMQELETGLRKEGYGDIQKYGICFYRKDCRVIL